mmetsp:Transcript_39705/g.92990  ORF Transcript_39705/g.92990 Transcript_39705/m.92990 type:complete len:154 (-) Transcript_39705:2232-2693(-)
MSFQGNTPRNPKSKPRGGAGWLLPSRPLPLREQQEADIFKKNSADDDEQQQKFPLTAERLIGTTRVGGSSSICPDGSLVAFEVRKYDFDEKKWNEQIWLADLTVANLGDDDETPNANHLRLLTSGSQHGWTSPTPPSFLPAEILLHSSQTGRQ